MRCAPDFASFAQFAREELRCNRSASWRLDDVTDDFVVCADLDLKAIEGIEEPEEDDD